MARARQKIRRPRSEDALSVRRIKDLNFGPPGHGKTHFLGTASTDERTAPIAILDYEGGVLDVLEGLPGRDETWFHIPIVNPTDFNEAYDRLLQNDEGFKSVGVDSVTEIHNLFMTLILDGEADKRQDPDAAQQQDWGKARIQLNRLVREFRDLPLHCFFTAHHKDEVDPREGMVKMPALSGKLATEVPGMMSVCAYLALTTTENGGTHRTLLLRNYAKIRTKVRTPWGLEIPDEIDDPTVTDLLDALKYDS